jgi:predicted enzyme related to lactoylglutathione lyase
MEYTYYVYFDFPADGIDRVKKFYKDLFGWKIDPVQGPMVYFEILTNNEEGKEVVAVGI